MATTNRIGIISDIHADAAALRLAIDRLAAIGCDRIVCCGDVVGYGTAPLETVRLLKAAKVSCIRGNHDRWALEDPDLYSSETIAFLSTLPTRLDLRVEEFSIAVRHGSPKCDMDTIYPDQEDLARAQADILIVGHVHMPYEIRGKAGMIINPGPVLTRPAPGPAGEVWVCSSVERKMVPLPQDGAGGTFGVLDLPARKFTVYRADDGTEVEITRKVLP